MKQKYKMRHRFTALLLAFMLCLSCFAAPSAFAMESSASESAPTSEANSAGQEVEVSSTPESAEPVPEAGSESSDTAEGLGEKTELSAEAQAFIAAVDALDREQILAAIDQWREASQAWQKDKENPDLIAALDEAIAVSDEAAAPVTAAEDIYLALPDSEKENDAVAAAYAALAALVVTMQMTVEQAVEPSVEGGSTGGTDAGAGAEPDLNEIAQMLYNDLPDAPTGSYMGSYGLPVATGDTKIGIGLWHDDQSAVIR